MKFFIFVNRVSEEEEKKLLFILLLLFISELATQIFTHTLNYILTQSSIYKSTKVQIYQI